MAEIDLWHSALGRQKVYLTSCIRHLSNNMVSFVAYNGHAIIAICRQKLIRSGRCIKFKFKVIHLFLCVHGTQFLILKAEILRKERNISGKVTVHRADSEVGNVSARKAALNSWTSTEKR